MPDPSTDQGGVGGWGVVPIPRHGVPALTRPHGQTSLAVSDACHQVAPREIEYHRREVTYDASAHLVHHIVRDGVNGLCGV